MLSLRTIKKSIMNASETVVAGAGTAAARIIVGTLDLGRPAEVVQPTRPRNRSFMRRLTEQEIDIRSWNANVDAANRQKQSDKLKRVQAQESRDRSAAIRRNEALAIRRRPAVTK